MKVEEDGTLSFENVLNLTAKIEPFKTFQLCEYRIYGDKEIKGTVNSVSALTRNNSIN